MTDISQNETKEISTLGMNAPNFTKEHNWKKKQFGPVYDELILLQDPVELGLDIPKQEARAQAFSVCQSLLDSAIKRYPKSQIRVTGSTQDHSRHIMPVYLILLEVF